MSNEESHSFLPVVGVLAVLGLGAWWFGGGGGGTPNVPAGFLRLNHGVRLSPRQGQFVTMMRAELDAKVPLTITSGTRDAEEQAMAMRKKIAAGATLTDIRELYGDGAAINEVLRYPQSLWGRVIQAQVSRGVFLSRHLRGDALDISERLPDSTEYMPDAWVRQIMATANYLGAEVIPEGSPPHIHVENLP